MRRPWWTRRDNSVEARTLYHFGRFTGPGWKAVFPHRWQAHLLAWLLSKAERVSEI